MAQHKNKQLVITLASVAVGMLMLAYAAVPLYQLFCQVTGFGGTTMRAAAAPLEATDRVMTVRFNADHDPNLPWKFTPLERKVQVKVGENRLIAYHAENTTDKPTRGTATYNVTPHAAGKYFNKIQCFCFQEQRLEAGEKVTMPVSFFIDPDILEDEELQDLQNITLSYTFFNYESANKSKLTDL